MVKENVKPKSQIEFFINKSAKEFNNSSLKIQYIAKQPCAASTRDL